MSSYEDALAADPEVKDLIGQELNRQQTTLQLIASENFTSPAVLAATGSVLTNKYSEGYPGRRYYGGNFIIDEVEDLARDRAKQLFGAAHANVQPHSGANANLAAYQALLEPGATVLAMRLDHGGHLTHGSPASIVSKFWRFVSYGVTPESHDPDNGPGEVIDFDQIAHLAKTEKPALIVAGSTAYARVIDPQPFREIADSVGAMFMFDAAHPAGLIAGGAHPSPVGIADVVTLTTHKTLRGPRAHGFRLVSRGTDNHLLLVDLRPFDADLTGKEAQEVLDRAGITCNRNTIPDDPRSAFQTSGLRLGTAAETTAGMGPAEMQQVADLLVRTLKARGDEGEVATVRSEVAALCAAFPPYPDLLG
jgi:glycine/serine hydroxymethyltransferase